MYVTHLVPPHVREVEQLPGADVAGQGHLLQPVGRSKRACVDVCGSEGGVVPKDEREGKGARAAACG